ncbi:hypothetical protein DEAC_c40240 [Desulfosporosinus acididurans]|uniref:Phage terminase, small subunit n=1 Tax=Desulfosporosinus acididurans TaxID=476652 RepID=A0A0J1FKN6_9FIRM|nr:hypothetical protein [Desulfosporosinus acididurans]KLU64030.1 hypothetical protein DEAC_c40240 [Desulfosporosinus acididurans]
MGGRNGQPVDLILAKGRSHHLTKEIVEQRKAAEIKTGTHILRCPDEVRKDDKALKKWKEIMKAYKLADFVSSGDVGSLGRYCLTYSEYLGYIEKRRILEDFPINWEKYRDILPEDFRYQIETILKLEPLVTIDNQLNKKNDLLTKSEDRSFLNPLAKVKNVPKKEPEHIDPLAAKGFGNV